MVIYPCILDSKESSLITHCAQVIQGYNKITKLKALVTSTVITLMWQRYSLDDSVVCHRTIIRVSCLFFLFPASHTRGSSVILPTVRVVRLLLRLSPSWHRRPTENPTDSAVNGCGCPPRVVLGPGHLLHTSPLDPGCRV